ncbi:uncharacterized protein LOC129618274 [Condylostylus longicornis]|uniref:uncharacterized protein LOC129618274 n=1 Tax=Condylostylus longicornis TaxID=2530218 RepID=UPI00244E2F6C|nr:uncharacterized protein LOC129618274 [Condylostylus longicornis]
MGAVRIAVPRSHSKRIPRMRNTFWNSGGTRTYDPRRDAEIAATVLKDQLEEEIATDSMRALEHKTYSTANELMALEQLDELRKINKRLLNRESTVDDALQWIKQGGLPKQEEEKVEELEGEDLEDFEKAREEISQRQLNSTLGHSSSGGEDSDHAAGYRTAQLNERDNLIKEESSSSSSSLIASSKVSLIVKKRCRPMNEVDSSKRSKVELCKVSEAPAGSSLLGVYDSDSGG